MMSLCAAKLLGAFFESVGYGVFFVMFVYTVYLQMCYFSSGSPKLPSVLLFVSSTLLFMMITTRWAIGVARVYEAVVDLGGQVPVSEYFADMTLKKQLAVSVLFQFQVAVADFILVYRLYHVWKPYWWLCIIPALAWFGVWISGGFLIWAMAHADDLSSGVFQQGVERWITSTFSFTILNNVYCTVAIIFRLWRSYRTVASTSLDSYVWRLLRVFAESAALLTISMAVTFTTFLAGSNIQYTFLDATSPIIGVSFLLILLRSYLKKYRSATTGSDPVGRRGVPVNSDPLLSVSVSVAQHLEVVSLVMEDTTAGKGPRGDVV